MKNFLLTFSFLLLAVPCFSGSTNHVNTVFVAPSGASSAFSFIASVDENNSGGGTTLTTTATLNVASGDLLVACASHEDAAANITISGDTNTNFVEVTQSVSGGNYQTCGYILSASADSTEQFTANYSASVIFRGVVVAQFRPSGGTTAIDNGVENTNGTGVSITTAAISTTETYGILIGSVKHYKTQTSWDSPEWDSTAATGEIEYGVGLNSEFWYTLTSATKTDVTGAVTANNSSNTWTADAFSFKSE